MARKSAQTESRNTRSAGIRASDFSQRNAETPTTATASPAPVIKRRLSTRVSSRAQHSGSVSALTTVIPAPTAASTGRRKKRVQGHEDAPKTSTPNDEQEVAAASSSGSSSALGSPLQSPQLSLKPEAAVAQGRAVRRLAKVTKPMPKSNAFAKPHKSPLILQQEKEDRAQRKKQERLKSQAAKDLPGDDVETAEEDTKARKAAAKRNKRDTERTKKLQELADLFQTPRVAPPPWPLQLTNLPPRQNITGRALPLRVPANDNTLPTTDAGRTAFVAQVLHAMRDVRQAQDAVSPTVEFWYVWLKPSFEGQFSYSELDMEWVCRKLVSIAEGLHHHGLGATEIFCPRTIQKAQAAKEMTFKERIDKLAELLRRSKARCNLFMLNNTLEDTLALIDQKIADQKSNGENNGNRSIKLFQANNVLGMKKGEKWPKDESGRPMIPVVPSREPQGMNVDRGYDMMNADGAGFAEGLPAQTQLLPWLNDHERLTPANQPTTPLMYQEPMEPLPFGFDLPRNPFRPTVGPHSDFQPFVFEAPAADHSLDAVQRIHDGKTGSQDDDFDMSQFLTFESEDEQIENARHKRPQHEQISEVSVNSLLRGKTAKPATRESDKRRR